MKIFVPRQHLPPGLGTEYQAIEQYFSGRLVDVTAEAGGLQLHLSWPDYAAFYVDPAISQGLAWWRKEMPIRQVPLEKMRRGRYQLSLNDNWTLYAWSEWLTKRTQAGNPPDEVIILHVDDHRDCMPPLLFQQPDGEYVDALSQQRVSLLEPDTIRDAIESGAVAVGSFMPPFLHHLPRVQLRHLLPSHRMAKAFRAGNVALVDESDALLCPNCTRPALKFNAKHHSAVVYLPTASLSDFLANLSPRAAVLLHVDMDYFNNRYDGDSDWRHHPPVHDPAGQAVYVRIEQIFSSILAAVPAAQLEDITVALSPGFFPAEFWSQSVFMIDEIMSSNR